MKLYLTLLFALLLIGCNTNSEKASTPSSSDAKSSTKVSSKEVTPAKPCDLFGKEELAKVFNIQAQSTIEMYTREGGMNTHQCQFIWQEEENAVMGSQVMIDISHKTDDMGATFSRMLELDLQNGLSASENGQIVNIKPTTINGFGDFAYHWTQPSFQNTHVLKFQVENDYSVKLTFNCHEGITVYQDDIKSKLIEIGKVIQQKL